MGKITVKGEARREFECDIMNINITFIAKGNTTAIASQKVLEQCETFLGQLAEVGVDVKKVNLSNDNIERSYGNEKMTFSVSRKIRIRIPFDMKLSNEVMLLIQQNNYSVYFDTTYECSNIDDIYRQLLRECIENSRQSAEIIAESMGQKITGIDTVEYEPDIYGVAIDEWLCREEMPHRLAECHEDLPISDTLSAPVNKHSQSVDVVWMME